MSEARYETREVLGGAYWGDPRVRGRRMLTHLVKIDGTETVMCKRVDYDNLADPYSRVRDTIPSCRPCRAAWYRLQLAPAPAPPQEGGG